MANNKIVYGDQTLIDLTSDTVTPETLAMGETAHSASGAQIVGTMTPSGGTHITPSNASPVALTGGSGYVADRDGYAIATYEDVDLQEYPMTSTYDGEMYKIIGNGGTIIDGPVDELRSSNSSPFRIPGENYYFLSKNAGYAIESYNSVTPSNSSPVALTSGNIYKASGAGYAIQSYNTKTVPSSTTATPVAVTNGEIDKISGNNGYLIHSYGSITPSSTGTYFDSGMRKMSSSGYAYSSKPTLTETVLWTNPSPSSNFSATTVTVSQDITNFSLIGVEWKRTTSDTNRYITAAPPDTLLMTESGYNSQANARERLSIGMLYTASGGTYFRFRMVKAMSNTTISISDGFHGGITSSTSSASRTTTPSSNIPTRIIGYKVS